MSQSSVVKRIEEICHEFDIRLETVSVAVARLELAKALAESEVRATEHCGGAALQSGEAPSQQLKQAIALVRAAGERDLYNGEKGLGFDFCLKIIEQRACI